MRRWQLIAALPLLLMAGACPPILAPATDADVWFVEGEREGGYWLGPDVLRKLDVDPLDKVPPPMHLSWSDQRVPHLPLRTEKGWGVFLFAADRSTRYTRRTAIRLERLYDYSGFLFQTVGGQAYLRRRSPEVEALGDVDWFYDQRGTLIRPELVNEVGEDADDTDEGPEE